MKIRFHSFALLAGLTIWLGMIPSPAQDQPFPVPESFVGKDKAPAPPNLPAKYQIPTFTRIDVTGKRKTPRPPPPPGDAFLQGKESRRLLWRPDLKSAEIQRDAKNVQMVYQWEGNRTSSAYQINGFTFWVPSLKYPNYIMPLPQPTVLGYAVNNIGASEGNPGDFPGLQWYTPDSYIGKASFDGAQVLVFEGGESVSEKFPPAPDPSSSVNPPPTAAAPKLEKVKQKLYVDAKTLRPVLLDAGDMLYMFSYTSDPGAQVVPDGIYAKAITQYFHQRNLPMQ